jgi:hypothetical protein
MVSFGGSVMNGKDKYHFNPNGEHKQIGELTEF